MTLDSQQVEILGRSRLLMELTNAGIEVAVPLRDRGVDLIAYADLKVATAVPTALRFDAKLIQMKAASRESFVLDRRLDRFQNLIMAYVWHVGSDARSVTFAMSYTDALKIGEAMKFLDTNAWLDGNRYSRNHISSRLRDLLELHRMSPAKWRELICRRG